MIKFVVPRQVKKIKRNYTPIESDKKKIKVWFRFFSIKIVWIVFIFFAWVYWSFMVLKNTIFNHQYVIKNIIYDTWDIQWYDNPYLYKLIGNWIRGENYSVVKRYISRVINDVVNQYPMVTDIGVDYRSSNTVFVKLTFKPIDMIIKNQDTKFALIGDVLLPLYSGNAIANGIKILDMPEYMSGINNFTGLFYKISAEILTQQIDILYQEFPNLHHIEYLAWWQRSIVYLDGKKYYINNLWDIPNQIKNYQLLKKYYKEFNSLDDVDLGSLEKDKIIVRRL